MFVTFYHSTTRKYVIMFGNLFNDIYIRRFNPDGSELQQIKVPIQYSPKMKWVNLIARHPADTPGINMQLPRIGFEVADMVPDPGRKLNAVHKLFDVVDDNNKLLSQFAPVPYKLNFELYIASKTTNDGLQIVEQILPYFNPDFNSTLNLIPELDYKYDIRVNLESVNKEDIYEGSFTERRGIIWTLGFSCDAWYFGPVQRQGLIKRVQIDLHAVGGQGPVTDEEVQRSGRTSRIVIKPGLTADGKPTTNAAESIPYQQINKEDDYGFIEELYSFHDGKKYDPIHGIDVPNE